MIELADDEYEVLDAMHGNRDYDPKGFGEGWLRPMDVGGRDGSRHSATLRRLASRGLVESQRRDFGYGPRGSRLYRMTDEGERARFAERECRVATAKCEAVASC